MYPIPPASAPPPGHRAPDERLMHACALMDAGEHDKARAVLQRLAAAHPRDGRTSDLLRLSHERRNEFEPALFHARKALALAPDDPWLAVVVARLLARLLRYAESEPILRAVLARAENEDARTMLGIILVATGRFAEGAAVAEPLAAGRPKEPEVFVTRGVGLLNTARSSQGAATLQRGMMQHPVNVRLADTLATTLNFTPDADERVVFEAHRNFGRLVRDSVVLGPKVATPPRRALDAGHRLRVGFWSADFRTHSCAYFVESLFKGLDRARLEVHAYATAGPEDHVTARLKPLTDLWRRVPAGPPHDIAGLIAKQNLDILVDLGGITLGHRLDVLALRPAPVQATYLGYPHTTGLDTIDYRVADALTDPPPPRDPTSPTAPLSPPPAAASPGQTAALTWTPAPGRCVERLIRLPRCFLAYTPTPEVVAASTQAPALRLARLARAGEPIVFGCFNALPKLSAPLYALWARILAGAPGSRLMIKNSALADEHTRRAHLDALAHAGVPADRVELRFAKDQHAQHLATWHEVDVALDPWPYHGTTTTCEALHLGVPVVSLTGRPHASRVGLSLLSAVGLPDLACPTADAYVATAVALAQDRPRLAQLARDLPAMVAASPLRDDASLGAAFTEALCLMHRAGPRGGASV